ncbi:putative GTP diphosphokinase RSH1, chloroplastic [Morus notabilis]|uniref:putative GTP diphosphokinase RSH1, chloroplastic n=1 Tax=Morus notabilis TaxID=981085 RepID=UPI000CED1B8C|nr:putative GTP diphosphokinase RSH1, chloroplastic [Morus notabilis]
MSCAWKAPRVLTGFFASTAHSPQCSSLLSNARNGRRTRTNFLAFEAHDGQKRCSGEPFIIHPVEVARILGELELDWESIAVGLLHDRVEDTNVVTFERMYIFVWCLVIRMISEVNK